MLCENVFSGFFLFGYVLKIKIVVVPGYCLVFMVLFIL